MTDKRKLGHTPKANHPWKKPFVPPEVRRWAMEQSQQTKITTWFERKATK